MEQQTFVEKHIEEFLVQNGWEKFYDSFQKVPVTVIRPSGYMGAQTGKKFEDESRYELHIAYDDLRSHDCSLYCGNSDNAAPFKLRVIKSMLKKLVG